MNIPRLVALGLFFGLNALCQHGVIREYAALAPKPDATLLRPLLDTPLTDISITLGHDHAYYMTGSAVAGDRAAYSKQVTIWRSADLRRWTRLRDISTGDRAVQSPELHYLRNRYWLTRISHKEGSGKPNLVA